MYDNWSEADLREEISRLMELAQHELTQFVQKSRSGTEHAIMVAQKHQEEAYRYRSLADNIRLTLNSR